MVLAAASALLVLLVVGGFNAIVDPYGTVGLVDRTGFNHYKPAAETRVRLVKAAELLRVRPAAIVLGTSRSHIGLRMSHAGWRASPRYNLAFDGATPAEMYAYLRDAETLHPLQRVVLGLDTWHLGKRPGIVRPDFDPSLLYDPDRPLTRLEVPLARVRILLSLDALAASLRTLGAQDEMEGHWLASDGQRLGDVFFHRPGEEFEQLGPARYFQEIDRREIGWKLPGPAPARTYAATNDAAPDATEFIRRIVAFCHERRIDLRIYITPAHAHQLVISAALGEWPLIEQGKRDLVELLAEEARAHSTAPFPLWDFSGFSSVTTEPVPPLSSADEMRYYWDSSHFKEVVGDFVLDRLFGISGLAVPPDFGRSLRPASVDAAIAEDEAALIQYRRRYPDDVAAIEGMIVAAQPTAGGLSLRTADAK